MRSGPYRQRKDNSKERVLYYTGRIRSIHKVRGNDAVGAEMNSMDLDEKGVSPFSLPQATAIGSNTRVATTRDTTSI